MKSLKIFLIIALLPMLLVAKKEALLIGISHYKDSNIPSLPGAMNDIAKMKKLFEKFGFNI